MQNGQKNLNSSGEIEVGDKNNLETSLNRAKMWASNFSATIDYRFLLDIMSACHDLIFQRNSVIQSWIVTQKTYHLGKFRPNLPKFWPNNFFRKRAFPGLPQNWKMNSSQKSWKQWRFSRHFATRIGKKHMIFQLFQPFQPSPSQKSIYQARKYQSIICISVQEWQGHLNEV